MMNFLDLSAASEDERRLIREILSDTSIVNIASPHPPLTPQQQPTLGDQAQSASADYHHTHQHQQHHENNTIHANSNVYNNNHHRVPSVMQTAKQQLDNTQANVKITNNVNNLKNPIYQHSPSYTSPNNLTHQHQPQNHHHLHNNQQQHQPENLPKNSVNNLKNHIYHNSHTPNNIAQHHHQQHHQPQQQHHPQQQQQQIDPHLKNNVSNNLKNQIYHHHSPPYTASNVTHQQQQRQNTTSTRPPAVPQPSAQMPAMAGDMNRVMGMDMGPTRPPGYAMTPYGPAPPTSHVYGAPPLFQHYPPHHYLIHYANIPQYMPYMMQPPTNPMVPPRLVPPQPNQSPSSPDSTSTTTINNLSHPHHTTISTTATTSTTTPTINDANVNLETSTANIGNNLQDSTQYENNNELINNNTNSLDNKSDGTPDHAKHSQTDKRIKDINDRLNQSHLITDESEFIHDKYETNQEAIELSSSEVNKQQSDIDELSNKSKLRNATTKQESNNAAKEGSQAKSENGSHSNQAESIESFEKKRLIESSNKQISEERVKSLSSEGFESGSNSEMLKQSQENTIPISDNNKTSPATDSTSNKLVSERVKEDQKLTDENAQKLQGPWGSASSKSWADLFKKRGTATNESSSDNDHDQNYNSDNSDYGDKLASSNLSKSSNKIGSLTATQKELRSQERSRRALDTMGPRLATKINTITLKHSLPFLKPRGFINKGNGCYINATLQALIACPPFYNLMKEIGDLKCHRRDNSCTPIIDSFAELFLNFPPLDSNKKNKQQQQQQQSQLQTTTPASTDQKMTINNLQAESIEPKCIYSVLGQIKSECLKGAQEDAEEFLSCVLNGLHEEMIGLSEFHNNNVSNDNNLINDRDVDESIDNNSDAMLWREVGAKNRSLPIRTAKVINTPIQEIFGGSLFSIRTAGKDRCGHVSPFFDLQLDISSDNVKSVQDAIKSFTAPEIINDFYCSKTKQKLDAQRRTFLAQLPPILILHLKQFVYTQDHGLRKLMKKIEYPIDFEIPDNCVYEKSSSNDRNLRMSRSYKLLAVVYHDGKEAIKGHYLTDVYHIGSSQWIRCDDSTLKVVHSPRIENSDSSRTPYLLFYRRLNTLRAQPSNHDSNNSTNKKKNNG